ncbi:MAG: DinB family protein [Gemmatimonadaceae bacterium]
MRAATSSPVSRFAISGALVALTLVCAPRLAVAQTTAAEAAAIRTAYLGQLDELQGKFLQLAEAIPADKYSWRPAPGVRSIGEVFMHIATEYYMYDPMAFGAPPSPVVGHDREALQKFEATSTKPEVLKHLKEGLAYTKQALGAVSPDSLLGKRKMFGHEFTQTELAFAMSGDLHEHLGQLIAYARMNGVKPPWSK